jgi:hypothetical protein
VVQVETDLEQTVIHQKADQIQVVDTTVEAEAAQVVTPAEVLVVDTTVAVEAVQVEIPVEDSIVAAEAAQVVIQVEIPVEDLIVAAEAAQEEKAEAINSAKEAATVTEIKDVTKAKVVNLASVRKKEAVEEAKETLTSVMRMIFEKYS